HYPPIIGNTSTSVFIELVTRQCAFDLSSTRITRSLSFSGCRKVIEGRTSAWVIKNFPSTTSSLICVLHSNLSNSTLEFSAIARKVAIKQLLIAAAYKCSGDQILGTPLGNSGGVAQAMRSSSTGEE